MLTFRVLGPLEVRNDDRVLELAAGKQRLLLAALLLRAGETVATDTLIEELWGTAPPRTAKGALVNNVSLLRKALGHGVLVTRAPGYLLDVTPDHTDLGQFERLTAEARDTASVAGRADKLREALSLWRGPAYVDLAFESFAQLEISRVEDLRLAARQDLIDAELELGHHTNLLLELETLIRQHPFDERLRGQLMLALYRAGRQADALEAYQATRRLLDEELGLEPGPPLRELEQAILRHDSSLNIATPAVRPQPSRRTVTVLVAGHPESSERDPETVAVELTALRIAVERYGGTTGRFAGDAAMAVFGVPRMHEDDALRGVRAAADLRAVLPELRIGIATGEVFADDESIAGKPVTVARQLEQAAERGDLLVAPSTLRLVRDAVRSRPAAREGLTAFSVDEVIEGAPGIARRLDRPLVDREAELDELRSAFATARDERRCIVFTGIGDAGIGKTRLARELIMQVSHEATVLVGRCASYGEGATFLPLREMIEDFDDVVASSGSMGEVFLAVRQRFEELAAKRPLLLVFEDVHWAEPSLLDLIHYLAAHASGPILALCLSRPDLQAGWSDVGSSLVLEPLTDEHARALAGDDPRADRIVEIAEGNPLYVEQLVASVEEAGREALDTVPGSIEALLASRLDRLGQAERDVAQRAAVVGRRFSPTAVAALGPAEALPGLEQSGFVHRAGTLYRFHHVLVRDVVYAGTPKAERAALHRRHAEWLDTHDGGPDELIGYHLEQAAGYLGELGATSDEGELAAEAGRRLGRAGIRAWKRGDARTTISLLGRAVALLPEREPYRLELMCELGQAVRLGGDFARSEDVLTAAREEAEAVGDRRYELRAELGLLQLELSVNPSSDADAFLAASALAVPVFEEHSDERALGRAWLDIAEIHGMYHYRQAEAEAAARRALIHYERAGWPYSACLGAIGSALGYGPMPVEEALATCHELLAAADLNGQSALLPTVANLTAMTGDFDRARALLRRSREIRIDLGQSLVFEYGPRSIEWEIELMAGDLATAQEAVEASLAVLEQLGETAYVATRKATLADIHYRHGLYEAAAEHARSAQSGSTSDDVATEWLWRSVEARLAARAGDLPRANQLIDEAQQMLARTDAVVLRGRCLLHAAEVLSLAGRADEATAAIRKSLRLFEAKGDKPDAGRARSLLAETMKSPERGSSSAEDVG